VRPAIDLDGTFRRHGARPSEKHNPKDTHETGCRQRRRKGEQRADRRQEKFSPNAAAWTEPKWLERAAFRRKSISGARRRDSGTRNEERETRDRHRVDEAAETVHVALARRGQARPLRRKNKMLSCKSA